MSNAIEDVFQTYVEASTHGSGLRKAPILGQKVQAKFTNDGVGTELTGKCQVFCLKTMMFSPSDENA
jgi:hypothetical protein